MMVLFTSRSEKKALYTVRRILDAFADRIGNDTWHTCITEEGLLTVKTILKKNATKNMAVSCRWIRSRQRSELLWIVGNRNQFNAEGIVPVNWTTKNIAHQEWENHWQYLAFLQALTALAALFHDWGKASDYFQKKLRKGSKTRDPFRHEWISCRLLEALVDLSQHREDDTPWLTLLAEGSWDSDALAKQVQENRKSKKWHTLPPLASMLVWLILSHHHLPDLAEDRKMGYAETEKSSFLSMWQSLDDDWGYNNPELLAMGAQCFTFSKGLLGNQATSWQKLVKKWSARLLKETTSIAAFETGGKPLLENPALRNILGMARLSLMMADHYVSSLPKDPTPKGSTAWKVQDLWANIDRERGPKQYLEEHLVWVCKQAVQILYRFPFFAEQMERAYDTKGLKKKSPPAFAWQDKAVEKIKDFRETHPEKGAWFLINMASTGCGKTIANAKLMQAISDDGKSLRYILALGLRSLTLQTGDAYRSQLGLDETELAVLIGSTAVKELHDKDRTEEDYGSESAEELLPEEVEYIDTTDETQLQFMNLFMGEGNQRANKNRAFLYKPVLVTTIDHMMGAVQTIKGGRYMLPFLRLLSSDLVIDEVDDFNPKDVYAISRLVHLAGMLGRNVGISSATIPPDLAEGLYRAYRAGLKVYNSFFAEKKSCQVCWCDEYKATVSEMDTTDDTQFMEQHQKFVQSRIKKLSKEQIRRKGVLVPCEPVKTNNKEEMETKYFETIRQTAETLHEAHYIIDKKTGKHISFGIIRMANINPCVALSLYLLRSTWRPGYTVRLMTYHSRQILLLRHEQEKYLDQVLKRKYKKGEPVNLVDPVIRRHIDETDDKNITFIVVATPVEETGRDHDFDWAIIEPSSYRSIIQLSGRVLRHREMRGNIGSPNVAIMDYNLRGLYGEPRAFKWPGYEVGKYQLRTHDMQHLVDSERIAYSIDAVPRIQKSATLYPAEKLIDLEQQVMADFNSRKAKGPGTLHGWIEEYWWMTGLTLTWNRFREQGIEDASLFVTAKNGEECFNEWVDGELVKRQKFWNIQKYVLSLEEKKRCWLDRDYVHSYQKMEDQQEEGKLSQIFRFGEIILPTSGKGEVTWWYSDQLGLFKETKG